MLTFSLLVPCYNAEQHLPDFINNISKLHKKFDEVLFYDDGSTDKTLEIINTYGFKYIASKHNNGAAFARNKLAEQAKSTYIHFHDVDDLMEPNYLDEICKILHMNPNLDVVTCNVKWIDFKTRDITFNWIYESQEINAGSLSYILKNPIGGINGTYRKSTFIKIGGFDRQYKIWEDADLHVRLCLNKANFYHIDSELCIAVRHPRSLSSNQKYGWFCRLKHLESYLQTFPPNLKISICEELEKCAYSLIKYNDFINSKKAYKLAQMSGYQMPTTNNSFLLKAKKISPYGAFLLKSFILKILK